jgi:hypothetical protein
MGYENDWGRLWISIHEAATAEEREPSTADDYVAERIRQCDAMGVDPLEEMGYFWRWEASL